MTSISLAMPAPIPADLIGTLVPGALFGIWSVLVVAIVVGLCAVLGAEARRHAGEAWLVRRRLEAERNAA